MDGVDKAEREEKIKFFGARLLLSNKKKTQEILPSYFCLVLSQK